MHMYAVEYALTTVSGLSFGQILIDSNDASFDFRELLRTVTECTREDDNHIKAG